MQQDIKQSYSVKEAASFLNIGSNTLFKKLREQGVLSHRNLPRSDLVKAGYFEVSLRQFEKRTDRFAVKQQYAVTLVTGPGLAFIQELIDPPEEDKPECQAK